MISLFMNSVSQLESEHKNIRCIPYKFCNKIKCHLWKLYKSLADNIQSKRNLIYQYTLIRYIDNDILFEINELCNNIDEEYSYSVMAIHKKCKKEDRLIQYKKHINISILLDHYSNLSKELQIIIAQFYSGKKYFHIYYKIIYNVKKCPRVMTKRLYLH